MAPHPLPQSCSSPSPPPHHSTLQWHHVHCTLEEEQQEEQQQDEEQQEEEQQEEEQQEEEQEEKEQLYQHRPQIAKTYFCVENSVTFARSSRQLFWMFFLHAIAV